MTSERRIAANRANARKSTGPRTAAGRRRASQNARRHGLTTAPSADRRAHHLEIILDDPRLRSRPLSGEALGLAQSLADAEAQLERVKKAEVQFVMQHFSSDGRVVGSVALEGSGTTDGTRDAIPPGEDRAAARPVDFAGGPDLDRVSSERDEETDAKEMRRLLRYRSEAESRRRRALKDWIAFLGRL